MNYYKKRILLAEVDKNDNVVGKIERWEAHKKGILHRGVTTAIFYKDYIICQHRKHPVFNGYLDLTFSTHPFFEKEKLVDMEEAINLSLKREWNINKSDLLYKPEYKGKVYYYSPQKDAKYIEHEVCHLYISKVRSLPKVNFEYSYGFSLLTISDLKSLSPVKAFLAPWVWEFFRKRLL